VGLLVFCNRIPVTASTLSELVGVELSGVSIFEFSPACANGEYIFILLAPLLKSTWLPLLLSAALSPAVVVKADGVAVALAAASILLSLSGFTFSMVEVLMLLTIKYYGH